MNFALLKKISIYIAFFLTLTSLASCLKKDTPITLPAKGNGTLMQVEMGENYEFQYYINLRQNKIVLVNRHDNWDLAFECKPMGHAIFLNSGEDMAAYNTSKHDFASVNGIDVSKASENWQYDRPSGKIDSTAIGDWKFSNNVYIIRLDKDGNKLRKLQITYEDDFQYIIAVGDINSVSSASITIKKNPNQNFVYFSFDLLKIVEGVEPADKTSWDVQASLYSFIFYDQKPALPYVVNGFILNPNATLGYKDSLNDYNSIDANFINSITLTSQNDIIGYDWKQYDINSNVYSVNKKYNYIIKTQNDAVFKIRFLDFYSATGVKGSPKFEFNQIL